MGRARKFLPVDLGCFFLPIGHTYYVLVKNIEKNYSVGVFKFKFFTHIHLNFKFQKIIL